MSYLRGLKFIIISLVFFAISIAGQSKDQNFPTPVTTNQIIGTIKARDIGDSRSTTYYYAFAGTQGDIFINVLTKDFVGDIDIFAQDGLKPLAKIVVFDPSLNETGRLIYLRKEERLLLRIQGKTPGDEAANFQIKFAGSFVALKEGKEEAPPAITNDDADRSVNSVGTKLPQKPKPVEPQKVQNAEGPAKRSEPAKPATIADNRPVKKESDEAVKPKPEVRVESTIQPPAKITPPPKATTAKTPVVKNPPPGKKSPVKETPKEKAPDPLASIKLMILMKDGSVIERQMNEVIKFSVDKGILVVVLKGGNTSRFPIVDVARVTIE